MDIERIGQVVKCIVCYHSAFEAFLGGETVRIRKSNESTDSTF